MNSYIFLSLLSVVCNTVDTSVAYNRLKRNNELTQSAVHSPEKKGIQTYIAGGVSEKLSDAPGIVALNYKADKNRRCSGTIIDKKTIMTAGHCVDDLKPSQLTVRAGSKYFGKGGLTYKVTHIIPHPDLNKPHDLNNDIALIKVSKDIAFDGKTIAAVKLPARRSDPAPGSNVKVVGWGNPGYTQEYPKSLKKVNTTIIDLDACIERFHIWNFDVNQNNICTQGSEGAKSPCPGDSGGPLLLGKTQLGIVSFGRNCNEEPAVYVRVDKYLDFIDKNKAQN